MFIFIRTKNIIIFIFGFMMYANLLWLAFGSRNRQTKKNFIKMISCGTEYRYTNILDNLNHSIRDFWRKKKLWKKCVHRKKINVGEHWAIWTKCRITNYRAHMTSLLLKQLKQKQLNSHGYRKLATISIIFFI